MASLASLTIAACGGDPSPPDPGLSTEPVEHDSGSSTTPNPDTEVDSGSTTPPDESADAGAPADAGKDSGAKGFMASCAKVGNPGDCEGVGLQCVNFTQKGKFCTHACKTATSAKDCPAPSAGCGGQGVCKPK
jgi:hypothetical protein